MEEALTVNHLLGIKEINYEDIQLIFRTADEFKTVINRPIKRVPTLRDITPEQEFLLNWLKKDLRQILLILLLHLLLLPREKP